MKKYLTWNNLFRVIATTVAVAGVLVAAPAAVVPVAVGAVALKVLTYGTIAGLVAAKVLPGNGTNAPEKPLEMPKP